MQGERVVFCVFAEEGQESMERVSCLFAEECLRAELRLCIHVEDEASVKRLDLALWTFRDISFVPHQGVATGGPDPDPLITIGYLDQLPDIGHGVLFNLAGLQPQHYPGYARLIELVPSAPQQRRASRARYRRYRELGYALEQVEVPVNATVVAGSPWIGEALGLQ